jgi:hypothetical protein
MTNVMILVVVTFIGLLLTRDWFTGSSSFGFESPYWDLGLLPIAAALVIGACRVGGCNATRQRILLGFAIFGLAAVAAYIFSCSHTARWSLVSALLPFQTGLMLAPDVGYSWKDLNFWGILVDTAILMAIPLIVAGVGGVLFSVRFTMRRIGVAVAVIAMLLAALVSVGRRIRRFDSLGHYHRTQIVGQLYGTPGLDGKVTFVVSPVDQKGRPVPHRQLIMDRWHEQMAQKYWRAARYPWLHVEPEQPPHD